MVLNKMSERIPVFLTALLYLQKAKSSHKFFFLRADGLEAKFSPERDLSMIVFGWPCVLRHCLNFTRLSLNLVFKELVLSVNETVFKAGAY